MDTHPSSPSCPSGTCDVPLARTSQSIDWYHEGKAKTVQVDGITITVQLIGRKGRRARIAITAPAGARFVDLQRHQ